MNMLEGVRRVLTMVDGSFTAALDPQGSVGPSKAGIAQGCIDEASQSIQTGYTWAFSDFRDVTIEPAADGTITLPADALHAVPFAEDAHRRIAYIGRGLYDHDNNTNQFTAPIQIRYQPLYTFECLPPHLQEYVVCQAAYCMINSNIARWGNRLRMVANAVRESKGTAKCINATIAKPQMTSLQSAGRIAAIGSGYVLPE
jgi:hypothetical protein